MSMRQFAGTVIIRRAQTSDLGAIVALERSIQEAAHWPAREYASMLTSADQNSVQRHLVIAERGGELLGYAVGKLVRYGDSKLGELENIAVAAEARRAGVGRSLCVALLEWWRAAGAETIELEVRAGNASAIALYESLGWSRTGGRRDYYHDPVEDAVLMARDARQNPSAV